MAEQHIQVRVPAENVPGIFADFVRAWHTRDAFVLDFSVFAEPGRQEEDRTVWDAQVVSRVRIPPGQVFELMRALENQLTAWEKENPDRKA
ncbi:MAG: DUF3467 domain-containing protein [Propionibacteriaceae bacterium]|jgi:hypothetical protein|nr:DUF3467 domain-containing protein [Propionibacteriaceae bacterium]